MARPSRSPAMIGRTGAEPAHRVRGEIGAHSHALRSCELPGLAARGVGHWRGDWVANLLGCTAALLARWLDPLGRACLCHRRHHRRAETSVRALWALA